MIKIEFPADRADIALAMAEALMSIAGQSIAAGSRVLSAERPHHERLDQATKDANAADDERRAASKVTVHGTVNTQTGEVLDPELPTNPGDTARLDTKGVAFDAKYCSNAADPFYATGKESGQWKAKRGLAAGVYDAWYSEQLAASATQTAADEDTDPTPTVATGAAFGAAVTQPAASAAPADLGQFMAWVSEQMVAGRLQQATIDGAYTALGIRIQDLVPPTPPAVVTNNLTALHSFLAPIVAGA